MVYEFELIMENAGAHLMRKRKRKRKNLLVNTPENVLIQKKRGTRPSTLNRCAFDYA